MGKNDCRGGCGRCSRFHPLLDFPYLRFVEELHKTGVSDEGINIPCSHRLHHRRIIQKRLHLRIVLHGHDQGHGTFIIEQLLPQRLNLGGDRGITGSCLVTGKNGSGMNGDE